VSWQQIINIAIIVIVFGASALGWAVKQFGEYQAAKRAKAEALRRREQMLRTGRADERAPTLLDEDRAAAQLSPGAPSQHDDARRRLIELAQKRQAQLAEMARRAAGGGQTASPPAMPTPRPMPVSRGGSPRPAVGPGQVRAGSGQPMVSADEQRRRAEKRAKAEAARKRSEAQARQQAAADAEDREAATRRAAAERAREAEEAATAEGTGRRTNVAAAIGNLRLGAGSAQGNLERWRNAMILTEVLGPPLAMREAGRDGSL
jgi:colicin import membrane protein